jgi:hypothetical protein
MSSVSRQFWTELKQNYRSPDFAQTLIDVHHFFEWLDIQPDVRSWIHFQIMITCEKLIEEHANFTYTVLRDRNFTEQQGLQKFQQELDIFNSFQIVLSTCNLKMVRYGAIRNLRDCQQRQKKFCESSDWKIERALERKQREQEQLTQQPVVQQRQPQKRVRYF